MLRWRNGTAGDPVEEVSVGAVELALVKAGEMGISKAAEDQVALPRAAMPGTEREPLAADVR